MGASNSKSASEGNFPNRTRADSNLSLSMRSKSSLQMVRERDARRHTFEEIYKVEYEIGQGGLCKVYKIRKIGHKIGGSSRPENVIRARTIVGLSIPPSPSRPKAVKRLARLPSDMSKYLVDGVTAAEPMCFALKVFNLALLKEEKVVNLHGEVEILSHMDHPFIVKLFETFETKKPQRLSLVMELCTGGDMYARIPYAERQVAVAMQQVLSAIKYMHSNNIIHRDIKMENIMWESPDPQARIKLIDFGLSKEYSPQNHILTERVGTLYSMSPETMKGIYTEQADLWSVAVCAFIMLTNGQCKPFEGRTPKEVVAKVLRGDYEFDDQVWKDISDEAKDFIAKLLVVQPSERPTAAMSLEHPWIVEGNQAMAESISTTEEFKTRVRDNIVRYADMGEFRKLALNVMAKKSSTSEIIELRKVFEEFDTLNTGAITLEEFTAALSQLNYREDEITEIFKKVDVNNSNVINYTEFLAATLEAQGAIEEYRIAEAFDAIDSDDSGYISRRNLRKILGGRSDEKYIDTLIAEADLRNDGRISYEEFLQVFAEQKHENMRSLYEGSNPDNSPRKSSDEDLLRKHGIIKSIRKNLSSGNLKRFASFSSSKS